MTPDLVGLGGRHHHRYMSGAAFPLIAGIRSVRGWYSGVSIDSEDTLAFCARTGVRSINEVVPLAQVTKGYERMMSGKARFRVVLTMER